jgi:hypothetical protein
MNGAFGHALLPLAPEQIAERRALGLLCSLGRGNAGACPRDALYEASYRYTNRRTGGEVQRRFGACRKHAEAFATKHGLTLPEPEVDRG